MTIIPLLILLFAAILTLLFWRWPKVQKAVSVVALIGYLGVAIAMLTEVRRSGIMVLQIGGYQAPFGITLVADLFACMMILITAIIGFSCLLFGIQDVSASRKARGYYPIYLFMLLGVSGSFLAGDVFNLYVWFEVMLVASFVLISLGCTKSQLEGSVKYVVLNFISSGFFLAGIGILYKAVGTMNMADISSLLSSNQENELVTLASIFFLICFGIKSAIFPLFFWLPASYHTPPASISGLMAGLLTKVGVYALIRFFTLIFVQEVDFTHQLLLIIAGFTMLSGVLGAMAQMEFRKILSFHIVSQIGYMIMGLAIYTPMAIAGSLFYILHHIIVKTNLFLISGLTNEVQGSYSLKKLGGIYDYYPLVAFCFMISGFSLAGVPPLSGFWGKFILAEAGFEAARPVIVAISLLVGLLTLYSMIKIWQSVFWQKAPERNQEVSDVRIISQSALLRSKYLMVIPVIILAILTLCIGFYPDYLIGLSMEAADQLLNPEEYIKVVLDPK